MGAGRRQKPPGSETEDIIIHSIAGSMGFLSTLISLVPQVPLGGRVEQPRWMLHAQGICVTAQEPELKKPHSFKGVAGKPAHFLP